MLTDEMLQKIRRIEITTRRLVDDAMSGQYKSQFKGHGVQFSEHRVYVPGDDVRHIDWKVSARSRDPLIKKYEEERELQVMLIVDISRSEVFGSSKKTKSEAVAEVTAMLAMAASRTGDKVGGLLFAGEVEAMIPPKKGRQHVLRLVRDVLTLEAKSKGTDLKKALQSAMRLMKHKGVVFIISDFLAAGYETELKRLAKTHDVVALWVCDDREFAIPKLGYLLLQEPESGTEAWVDSSSYTFQKWMKEQSVKRQNETVNLFKSAKIESVKIVTKENYADALVRFFALRARRQQRRA